MEFLSFAVKSVRVEGIIVRVGYTIQSEPGDEPFGIKYEKIDKPQDFDPKIFEGFKLNKEELSGCDIKLDGNLDVKKLLHDKLSGAL